MIYHLVKSFPGQDWWGKKGKSEFVGLPVNSILMRKEAFNNWHFSWSFRSPKWGGCITTSPAIYQDVYPPDSTTRTSLNTWSKCVLQVQSSIQKEHKPPVPLAFSSSPNLSFDCMRLSNTSPIWLKNVAVLTFLVSPKRHFFFKSSIISGSIFNPSYLMVKSSFLH